MNQVKCVIVWPWCGASGVIVGCPKFRISRGQPATLYKDYMKWLLRTLYDGSANNMLTLITLHNVQNGDLYDKKNSNFKLGWGYLITTLLCLVGTSLTESLVQSPSIKFQSSSFGKWINKWRRRSNLSNRNDMLSQRATISDDTAFCAFHKGHELNLHVQYVPEMLRELQHLHDEKRH